MKSKFLLVFLFGLILYLLFPAVNHLFTYKAWTLFTIFASTILGIIVKPLPVSGVALIGLTAALMLGVLDIKNQALAGFSSTTIWLIISIFAVAKGFIKSRLGERVAYHFIYLTGKRTLGLAYALAWTEFLFAPFIPSSTARAGGIMMPIVVSIAHSFDSSPHNNSHRKIGAYLMQVGFHSNIISSATFLTGMVSNPLCQSFARQQGIDFSWIQWLTAAIVPSILSILFVPWLLYIIYPPEQTTVPEAPALAQKKLQELGSIKRSEIIMVCVFLLMLVLWVGGDTWGIPAAATAILGSVLVFVSGVIDFQDILAEKEAWNTMIWLAILITMSGALAQYGFIEVITQKLSYAVRDLPWLWAFLGLTASYFFMGYGFAGNSAHASALYTSYLTVLVAIGTAPLIAALSLAFLSSLYSSFTHYGSSAAGIYFSKGYIDTRTWWRVGFCVALSSFVIWIGVGLVWWRLIGFL